MSELVNRAVELVKYAAELEELRMDMSYEAIGGHGATHPGGEDAGLIQRTKEQGLYVADEDKLRFTRHMDYKMRKLMRSMEILSDEAKKVLVSRS